jgi:hypothetical protein
MTDQTADALIQTLHDVCADLSDRAFVVCSVVTDNASNEIAAVRDLRTRLGLPDFRVPCLSHITTLAVKDFLADEFPRILGRDFYDVMSDMRKLLPHKREDDAFRGIPRPCETRWTSVENFTEYVVRHQDRICAFLRHEYPTRQGRPPAASLPFDVGFEQPTSRFGLLNTVVQWTEGHDASLARAWSASLSIFQRFVPLSQQRNESAARCSQAFSRRLTGTAGLSQLILGHLVTRE